jgi:hypothetical protein
MNDIEKLYNSYLKSGRSDDQIYSSLVLSGYNPSDVTSYMDYAKKKRQNPTKEYGQEFSQNVYTQVQGDSVSQSTSGFGKPLSESDYSAVTKVNFEPVGGPVDGYQQYKPVSEIQIGEPVFGAEAAALGEIEKKQDFVGFSDPMSLKDFMGLDMEVKENFMGALNDIVPNQKERIDLANAYAYAYEGVGADPEGPIPEGGRADLRKGIKDDLKLKMNSYRKKFFNDKIKEAISGTFQEGQDAVSLEKYILDNYGLTTQIDDNAFVGTEEGAYEQIKNLFVPNIGHATDGFLAGGLRLIAQDRLLPKGTLYDSLYNYFGFEERRAQRERDMLEGKAVRFMADEEMEAIGMHVDRMLTTPLQAIGYREGFSETDMIEMLGNSPGTLSSQVAGGLAAAAALYFTKNPSAARAAAGSAYALTQATFMGLQVMGQEYGSTYSDPNFYNYSINGDPVSMDEATEVNEYGELVLKEGYERVHDHFRAAGHSEVSAFSEFGAEYLGNLIMVKGGGAVMRGVGVSRPGMSIGVGVADVTGSKALGRSAQYLIGGVVPAVTIGSYIEGQEEVVTEILQTASRRQFSQQSGASAYGLFSEVYQGFIDPDEELQENIKKARGAGEFFGMLFGGGIATANIVQNEVGIKKANKAAAQNQRRRDTINKKNGTNYSATQYIDPDYFNSYEEWSQYENNRNLYNNQILKAIHAHKGAITMGMSRSERKVHNKLMKELDSLFKTRNENGEVDLEAIVAMLPSLASKLDAVRGNINMSESIVENLIKSAQHGNLEAAEFLLEVARTQLDFSAAMKAIYNPNLDGNIEKTLRSELSSLEKRNQELVKMAYDHAEGKGFRYTIVTDPRTASEAGQVQVYEKQGDTYRVRYTNAADVPAGTIKDSSEGRFSYTELSEGATEVTESDVDNTSLSDQQKSDLKRLISRSPNARVIIHDSQDSLDKVGSRAGLLGKQAFTLQDFDGRVFEIHLLKNFTNEVAEEEFGHYEFNEELYKDEVRRPMIEAINKAIESDPNSALAEFVRVHNARLTGHNQKYIEVELLTNLGRAIAKGETTISDRVVKASDVESVFDPGRSGFRDYVSRFDKYLKGKGKVKELAYDPSQVDNEGSVEGTAASYKPTFLDGKIVYGHIPLSQFNASKNLEVSAKIKDYNHFRNWYAKMTGNHKRRLYSLSFEDDNGNRVPISSMPGHDVTDGRPLDWRGKELFYKRDYNTKEIISMEPVALTFQEKMARDHARNKEQDEARRQSKLNRFNNLNNIAMEALGVNIYTFAQRIPGIEQATDELGYKSGFTEESLEKIEVALAAELGVITLEPQTVALPVPRVPKNISGDIVEGTAASVKLPTLQYSTAEEQALLKELEVESLSDITPEMLRGLYGTTQNPALIATVAGGQEIEVLVDFWSGPKSNVTIGYINKNGNYATVSREITSGSEALMNREPDRYDPDPDVLVRSFGANTSRSVTGKYAAAIDKAKENGRLLLVVPASLAEENIYSDQQGYEVMLEDVVLRALTTWGDTNLKRKGVSTMSVSRPEGPDGYIGRDESGGENVSVVDVTVANLIGQAIDKAIAGTPSGGNFVQHFKRESVSLALDKENLQYPFNQITGGPAPKTGLLGGQIRGDIEVSKVVLKREADGNYDPKIVTEALRLIISLGNHYADETMANLGFAARKEIATQIVKSLDKVDNPFFDKKSKSSKARKYLFQESNINSLEYWNSVFLSDNYTRGGAHVVFMVQPEGYAGVSPKYKNKKGVKETYRYHAQAEENSVLAIKTDPNKTKKLVEEIIDIQNKGKKGYKQVKSSQKVDLEGTANSRRLGRISYTNGPSWQASNPTGFGKALDAVALKLQDKYHEVMLLQKDIEEFRGRRMAEGNDFNLAVDLMYGKTRNDLDALDAKLDDIKTSMKAEDIKSDDLSNFLYAMHARERNAKIAFDRPDMESGSGMTNEEAEEIIDKLGTNAMRRLASEVRSIVQDTRDTMRKYGLETNETIDVYEQMYDHYVPLSGLATDEQDDTTNSYPTGGIGMAVYGPTTRKAKGRKSKTDVNIIAQVVMQNARVKQLARKNEALLSLHSMFSGNPNEKVFSLWGPKNRMQTVEKNGKARNMSDSEMRARRDMVPVRINGEQHFIQFKNEHYANTINGLSVDPTNIITNAMRKPAQWLRNVFTVYDPNFFVTNFSRDIQSAIYNALAEAERADGTVSGVRVDELTKKLLSNTATSLRGLLNENAFGKEMSPELKQYFEEWKESGGQTGWGYNKDIDAIIKELSDDAKKGLPSKVWKTAKDVASYVEGVNEAFENSVRLSAYMSARQLGVTRDRAAQLSKNITVNFNRSGEWGSTLNSIYLFFNAAMQGNARILRSMVYLKDTKKPNGELESWHKRTTLPQKVAFGMATFSGMVTMMNLAFSDEDEDGELFYNKISDYEKERNLIIMTGGKGYLKIPLPYGYNLFNNLGVMLAETVSGHRDADDAMMFLATSAISSFSPISFGQSDNAVDYATKAVMPTVLKPMVEIGMNETYFGDKVYMEQLPFGTPRPESQMSFRSPEDIQEFFIWLNEATGGSKYKSGKVDVNFDPYWYVFEYLSGGSGRFINQAGKTVYDVGQAAYAAGEAAYESENIPSFMRNLEEKPMPQFNLSRMPLARKIYGEASRYYDYDLFEENAEEIRQLKRELKEQPNVDPRRYTGVNVLYSRLKDVEKKLMKLRDRRSQAREIDDYIKRSEIITQIMEDERLYMVNFNMEYEKRRGKED